MQSSFFIKSGDNLGYLIYPHKPYNPSFHFIFHFLFHLILHYWGNIGYLFPVKRLRGHALESMFEKIFSGSFGVKGLGSCRIPGIQRSPSVP